MQEDKAPIPQEQPTPGDNSKPPDVYQSIVDVGLAENIHEARNCLNKCKTGYDTPEKAVAWMRIYRGERDGGKNPIEAAKVANEAK